MPAFGAIKRRDLISGLRKIGFSGPYSGAKHQYMLQGTKRVRIPNPHQSDVSVSLLRQILAEADITRDEWESV
jgi:HicA toxin of bacterial toxin-antitoxin,